MTLKVIKKHFGDDSLNVFVYDTKEDISTRMRAHPLS